MIYGEPTFASVTFHNKKYFFVQYQVKTVFIYPLQTTDETSSYSLHLDFDPTERPKWRDRIRVNKEPKPSISTMVSDICRFHKLFRENEKEITDDTLSKTKHDMLIYFLFKAQREEDIGVNSMDETKEIVETEIKSTQEESPVSNHTSQCSGGISSAKQTRNLYRALVHIEKEIGKDASLTGFLDVETFIKETHKILMQGEYKHPGTFSEDRRVSTFKGYTRQYPYFGESKLVECAVEMLIDEYNTMKRELKVNQNADPTASQLLLTFKCASIFLLVFLEIHPFGDGNGRMARLLSSYILRQFSPFHTPVYNVWSSTTEDDYKLALVETKTDFHADKIEYEDDAKKLVSQLLELKPCDLCSMIIESNWESWNTFFSKLGI